MTTPPPYGSKPNQQTLLQKPYSQKMNLPKGNQPTIVKAGSIQEYTLKSSQLISGGTNVNTTSSESNQPTNVTNVNTVSSLIGNQLKDAANTTVPPFRGSLARKERARRYHEKKAALAAQQGLPGGEIKKFPEITGAGVNPNTVSVIPSIPKTVNNVSSSNSDQQKNFATINRPYSAESNQPNSVTAVNTMSSFNNNQLKDAANIKVPPLKGSLTRKERNRKYHEKKAALAAQQGLSGGEIKKFPEITGAGVNPNTVSIIPSIPKMVNNVSSNSNQQKNLATVNRPYSSESNQPNSVTAVNTMSSFNNNQLKDAANIKVPPLRGSLARKERNRKYPEKKAAQQGLSGGEIKKFPEVTGARVNPNTLSIIPSIPKMVNNVSSNSNQQKNFATVNRPYSSESNQPNSVTAVNTMSSFNNNQLKDAANIKVPPLRGLLARKERNRKYHEKKAAQQGLLGGEIKKFPEVTGAGVNPNTVSVVPSIPKMVNSVSYSKSNQLKNTANIAVTPPRASLADKERARKYPKKQNSLVVQQGFHGGEIKKFIEVIGVVEKSGTMFGISSSLKTFKVNQANFSKSNRLTKSVANKVVTTLRGARARKERIHKYHERKALLAAQQGLQGMGIKKFIKVTGVIAKPKGSLVLPFCVPKTIKLVYCNAAMSLYVSPKTEEQKKAERAYMFANACAVIKARDKQCALDEEQRKRAKPVVLSHRRAIKICGKVFNRRRLVKSLKLLTSLVTQPIPKFNAGKEEPSI